MLVFTIVLPWIEAMYKTDFCQLEMILENDKQFETIPNIKHDNKEKRKRTIGILPIVMFYIFMILHIS